MSARTMASLRLLPDEYSRYRRPRSRSSAAATAGAPVFTPDLGTSAFGAALLAARIGGAGVALDPGEDLVALAHVLASRPRLGVIRTGETAVDGLLAQARDVLPVLGRTAPTLVGSVSLDAGPLGTGERAVSVAADAGFALPLLLTGLAQRCPGSRRSSSASANGVARDAAAALA